MCQLPPVLKMTRLTGSAVRKKWLENALSSTLSSSSTRTNHHNKTHRWVSKHLWTVRVDCNGSIKVTERTNANARVSRRLLCCCVLYSSRLVRGWNEMSKGQISWFLLCFSFSLVILIVIGIYLVPDKGLLVIHYFVSLLSLWLTHIFLWFMDRGKFATDIYWIFLYPSSLQASRKKVASRQARKRRILVNYSPKKREKERFHVCTKAVCHDFCKVSSWRVFCLNWNKQSFCLALINDHKPSIIGCACPP